MFSLFSYRASAGNADLFSVNEDQIRSEMSELNLLEDYVLQNEGTTISLLQAENSSLIESISYNNDAFMTALSLNSPAGTIPAFFWGFCLGPIGVVIAYLIDEENLMWSVVGCLVASFFYGGGYLLL